MRKGWHVLGVLVAVSGAACGSSDDALIESYFKVSNDGDVRALEQIATVQFDQQVDGWTKVAVSEETRAPVTLPALVKEYEELKAESEAMHEEQSRYVLEHLSAVEKVKSLLEDEKKIPADLEEVAEAWKELSSREEELKAAAADARDAMERELRVCAVSAGEASDLATSAGEVVSKEIELSLTIDGEEKPYVMTLRRYMLEETDTPHEISRWMVYDLKPKG